MARPESKMIMGYLFNEFMNVPEATPLSWEWPTPVPANTFPFFFAPA